MITCNVGLLRRGYYYTHKGNWDLDNVYGANAREGRGICTCAHA